VSTACSFPEISYIGFPFSISETFQQRNTRSSISDSLNTIQALLDQCEQAGKEAVIYLSMGFGNPYGDEWSPAILEDYSGQLSDAGCRILALADTTGVSTPEQIKSIFPGLKQHFSHIEWGLHLHSTPFDTMAKLKAALDSGCT